MRTLAYIGAFFTGALTGAALGVLLAPEKGSETQQRLTDAVNDFCAKHNIHLTKQDVSAFVEKLHKIHLSGHCPCTPCADEPTTEE